ncbi:hypothetical protein A7X67_04560 [Clostridium sp. W14A]|nr:hypothetical protein A7X67_04560 [Clostridium sp. W14A]
MKFLNFKEQLHAGKALFYWQRLKALGVFLRLQRYFSPPAPSHFMEAACFRFEIRMGGVWGRFDDIFCSTLKLF